MVARVVVTGANGSGKSHFAKRLSEARPDVPLHSFDAIKLTTDWQMRPRREIDYRLAQVVETSAWILEGGPSLLTIALPQADAVVWLDPSFATRTWRLAVRPWRNLGRTRAELPKGNPDRLFMQYRFAIKSLRKEQTFRDQIQSALADLPETRLWHCRHNRAVSDALDELTPRHGAVQ